MHTLIIGVLTTLMALDCVFLVFLILLQLPKKEAGAGLAFGGTTTDALFGAGSGNVLTKITKWSAAAFFAFAILLACIGKPPKSALNFQEQLTKPVAGAAATTAAQPAAAPAATTSAAVPAATPAPASSSLPAEKTTEAAPTNK
jgi:preprotein translocase subunit SecG